MNIIASIKHTILNLRWKIGRVVMGTQHLTSVAEAYTLLGEYHVLKHLSETDFIPPDSWMEDDPEAHRCAKHWAEALFEERYTGPEAGLDHLLEKAGAL